MKNIFLQILAITAMSVGLGWIYRDSLPDDCKGSKKLAWIREEKPVEYAATSDILAEITAPADTAKKNISTVPARVDTVAAKKIDTASSKKTQEKIAQNTSLTEPEAPVEVKNITYETVAKLKENPNVLFIDARNAEDFSAGHIDGAMNIFTHEFQQNIPKIIGIPRDRPIVVYCGGGACELSHELAAELKNFGFKKLYVYVGGWNEWSKKAAEQK